LLGIYLESINKDICIMFRIFACFYFVGTCQILFIQCNIPHTFFQAKEEKFVIGKEFGLIKN
jgi:hypothetical protein